MRRILTIAVLAALVAAPNAFAAKPTKAEKRAAQALCRAERGTTEATIAAFREKYGTNHNKRNAFGKCVSQQAKAAASEDAEDTAERVNAAKACDEERGDSAESREAFEDKYGTNKNKRNAFGKCVSAKEDAA